MVLLLLLLLTFILYGPIVKSMIIMTGAPNVVAPIRDLLLFVLGLILLMPVNVERGRLAARSPP